MTATEKERQCIDYSLQIRKLVIERKLSDVKNDGNFEKIKKEITNQFLVNYEVSEIKTFSQLWDDKGLRNWGRAHLHLTGFTEDEQLSCIKYWYIALYEKSDFDFEKLIDTIQENRRKSISEFYSQNPCGHISPISIVQSLPKEIDRIYGDYETLNDETLNAKRKMKEYEQFISIAESNLSNNNEMADIAALEYFKKAFSISQADKDVGQTINLLERIINYKNYKYKFDFDENIRFVNLFVECCNVKGFERLYNIIADDFVCISREFGRNKKGFIDSIYWLRKSWTGCKIEIGVYEFHYGKKPCVILDDYGILIFDIERNKIIRAFEYKIDKQLERLKLKKILMNSFSKTKPISNSNTIIGAVIGDVIGSVFEWNNVKTTNFDLFNPKCDFTDDTVLTIAVADSILNKKDFAKTIWEYGRKYRGRGYGGSFRKWLQEDDLKPYGSFGNGSAMRASAVGFAFNDIETVMEVAKQSAEVTHNHPEGIKGAQATATAIFLARQGKSKKEIKDYITQTFDYNLDFTLDEIRPTYKFDVTCQGSVPQSIVAFLESSDFESAIRLAISIGGDSDTIACITGGIASAFYEQIPTEIMNFVVDRLPSEYIEIMNRFDEIYDRK